MNTLDRKLSTSICAAAFLAACCASTMAQTGAPKLAAVYSGSWTNLEQPAQGSMRFTIDKVEPDGAVQGTYSRDALLCWTKAAAMKGKLEGGTLTLVPDFGSNVKCNDTKWTFQVQPDGTLTGKGYSYFQLKAELKADVKSAGQ